MKKSIVASAVLILATPALADSKAGRVVWNGVAYDSTSKTLMVDGRRYGNCRQTPIPPTLKEVGAIVLQCRGARVQLHGDGRAQSARVFD